MRARASGALLTGTYGQGKKALTENALVLQVWGFSVGLTTPPSKNYIVKQKHRSTKDTSAVL